MERDRRRNHRKWGPGADVHHDVPARHPKRNLSLCRSKQEDDIAYNTLE